MLKGIEEPEILSMEIIKPSSTDINHPKMHTLSFFDLNSPRIFVSVVYFYANAEEGRIDFHRSDALKKSLSAALSLYYPLAGRSNKDNLTIDCNDEGAIFLEARICCRLSSLREDTINLLFPDGLHYKDPNSSSPLAVQVTYFDCGGMAIAICISHAIMDMSSMSCFFNDCASMTLDSSNPGLMTRPEFNFGTLYPPIDLPAVRSPSNQFEQVKCVQRSFVFDDAKIAKLKAMVKVVENPTRLEVVVALIFKCAVSSATRIRSSSGLVKPAKMRLPVNLRSRVCPPFSESAMGNFVGLMWVSFSREEMGKLEWVQMVGKIRKEKYNYFNGCSKSSSGESLRSFVSERAKWRKESGYDDQDVYFFSNWCRFRFYEANFGWGKPAWVSIGRMEVKNWIHMMDTKGGGIEVLLNLEEEHMALFESDQDLLAFATINPNPLS